MRLAVLALIASVFFALPAHADPPKPDVTVVRKEIDLVLHADVDFTKEQRAGIERAAAEWKKLSGGRVRISVVYDLDFDSPIGLKQHKDAKHNVLISITEQARIVQEEDAFLAQQYGLPVGTVKVQAMTAAPPKHPIVMMWAVVDRIKPAKFRQIMQHEMGHAIGLPDLPTAGKDIMSGISKDSTDTLEFSEADRDLCRKALYCD